MIKVSKKVLDILCKPYGILNFSLEYLGGGREESEGIVYKYDTKYGKRVLKVLSFPKDEKEKYIALKERFEYAKFLVENGINITYPLLNTEGNLYEYYCDEKNTYIAYSMVFVEGISPADIKDLNDEVIHEWGRMTGKIHNAAKKFSIWKNISSYNYEYGFIDEVNNFYNMCSNENVKNKLIEVYKKISRLPVNRDTYGFIHNDNHSNNILLNNGKITFIDFEFSACQFFINDIVTPIERFMFKDWGGMYTPIINMDLIKHFLYVFISGYIEENCIDKIFIEEINTFIDYKRIIAYITMEKYLEGNEKVKNKFLRTIEDPPAIWLTLS